MHTRSAWMLSNRFSQKKNLKCTWSFIKQSPCVKIVCCCVKQFFFTQLTICSFHRYLLYYVARIKKTDKKKEKEERNRKENKKIRYSLEIHQYIDPWIRVCNDVECINTQFMFNSWTNMYMNKRKKHTNKNYDVKDVAYFIRT